MTGPEVGTGADAPDPRPGPAEARIAPHASREMASMFDEVSPRYDLLNRLMTLGRDGSWRRAMWREVPESARTALDLCTGDGSSLPGLRRPGRLVLGVDVSRRMLEHAAAEHGGSGWAPRLVCADAFRLPIRDGALDAVTIAFGVRNLRPRAAALAEIARVLAPGGRLVVLEATSPRPGPWAPFHALFLRRVVPLAGHLSPDPSAYAYLARSIEEFGSGPEFERDLAAAGFDLVGRRSFMLGASRLWSATRRGSGAGEMHPATLGKPPRGEMPNRSGRDAAEWRWWNVAQLAISVTLLASLLYAGWVFAKLGGRLPLAAWQAGAMRVLLVAGIVGFAVRCVVLWLRITSPPR
jgi:demethylmenaquinone methyltransferase/2-methoxy-6-polyprenyl-1,4-benzoquinol methylase